MVRVNYSSLYEYKPPAQVFENYEILMYSGESEAECFAIFGSKNK